MKRLTEKKWKLIEGNIRLYAKEKVLNDLAIEGRQFVHETEYSSLWVRIYQKEIIDFRKKSGLFFCE